jgi:hypothetical protein
VTAAARAYSEKECPRTSLRLLDAAQAMFGRASSLATLRDEIAKSSKADTRRWRRLPALVELAEWEAGSGWEAKDGALHATAEGPRFCTWREEPPSRYTLEVKIDASGLDAETGFVGITFGDNEKGMQFVGFNAKGAGEFGKLEKGWKPIGPLPSVKKDKLGGFVVRIEVYPGRAEFFLDGKSAGKPKSYGPEELAGKIGFVAQGGEVTFSDLRLCY